MHHHSPETSLLRVYEEINDAGSVALLVSLDISAAFDCIEHNILLSVSLDKVIPYMQVADGLG